jgi:transcriptional regulator with XRE-family HTH domain
VKPKDYADQPGSLGEHLKRRRRQLGLLQREVAKLIGCHQDTYINWEKDRTQPVASRFRPVIELLGYDPSPAPLAERVQAKRRELGVTFSQVAQYLGWDEGTLARYLNGTWRVPVSRVKALEAFLVGGPLCTAAINQVLRRVPKRRERKAPRARQSAY